MAKKKDISVKVKTMEVSARSFFGKSEMEKTIEKYEAEDWILVHQQKVPFKNRYTISFEYHLSPEEIEVEKRKQRNQSLGCLALLFVCGGFWFMSGGNRDGATNTRTPRSEPTRIVQVATVAPTNTVPSSVSATVVVEISTEVVRNTETQSDTNIPTKLAETEASNGAAAAQFSTNTPSIGRISVTPVSGVSASMATNTPRPTSSPAPTETVRASRTPAPTETPRSSNTPRPTQRPSTTTYYITGSSANVRSCSTTTCSIIDTRYLRDEVEVIEQVDGASVAGITRWYHVLLSDGRDGYIHSSLVSRTRPSVNSSSSNSSGGSSTGSSTGSSSGSGTGSGSGASNVQPTQPPPPVTGYTCNCSKTCGQMTCEEAYFQLNQCGCGQRDSDNDGVPCESVCSGG